ncbi:chloramphenicol resistance protein [Clostridium sp.]|uniref:chloramphenicol resistance protein n=1 Tax=Clostridium sp. TaxID=1506 RepID=UPI00321743EF
MNIVESIKEYIGTCPYLTNINDGINVNYLGENTVSYMIEELPREQTLKKYIDGSSLRQYCFMFVSREVYGQDIVQNIANSEFYENFAKWLELQSDLNNLPVLDNGKVAQKIEALTSGYVFEKNLDKAQYKIECRVVYYQEGGKNNE